MDAEKITLLIIDDESSVCRAIKRLMRDKADEIIAVQTLQDAETVLASRGVTHVLCDHLLGPGQPRGLDIAVNWKKDYPSLKKVIILTGTRIHLNDDPLPDGIDAILPKATDPDALSGYLEI
jgi:DNA-binding NtrC family response regulator